MKNKKKKSLKAVKAGLNNKIKSALNYPLKKKLDRKLFEYLLVWGCLPSVIYIDNEANEIIFLRPGEYRSMYHLLPIDSGSQSRKKTLKPKSLAKKNKIS